MDSISTKDSIKAVVAGLISAAPAADQLVMICNADGTPAKKWPAQKLIQDLATAGGGFGTCTTAADVQAKVVPISNFILLKNGSVAVRFLAGISVTGATLNVNSTGAKAIYIDGQPVQPGDVRAGQTAILTYDGSHWNIVSLRGLEPGGSAQDLYVDMGLPSGLLWARKNIDATQADGFAASEYQYECSFFSWGNVEPHNPTSNSSFAPYSFGSANDQEPYVSSPGAKIGYPGNAGPSHDAARTILGGPWREPSTDDFAELFNADYTKFIDADGNDIASDTVDKRIALNSIMGIRLKSKINGNILFFPCAGYGNGSSWDNRGSYGHYWSRSLRSAASGRNLYFYSGGVYPQDSLSRFYGFPVRPVQ